jgi:hydrogenase nickel incorporation protein HypB
VAAEGRGGKAVTNERVRIIDLQRNVIAKNDEIASDLRARFAEAKVFVINLLSAPGSGKTTLLEKTIEGLRDRIRFLVIEGDLKTARDAERIAATGAPAVQIVTNGTCHLESRMIRTVLEETSVADCDVIVIENVGNLVCPSSFDLGENARVVVASTAEGEDKPEKYPFMFEKADAVVLNKCDLLPYVSFDREMFWEAVSRVNRSAVRFEISCRSGEGLDRWFAWVGERVGAIR